MGILILFLLAVGAFVIARFLIQFLFRLIKKSSGRTSDYTAALNRQTGQKTVADPAQNHNKVRTVRVGRHSRTTFAQEDTPWDDLPKYKGETGIFGLPKYKDVVITDKHNYATVFYMDGWLRQYVYDLMSGWKDLVSKDAFKLLASFLFFVFCFGIIKLALCAMFILLGLWFVFWGLASGVRSERRSAERFRHFTPDDWREVYDEVRESQDRVDEMTRAFQRSGIHHRW